MHKIFLNGVGGLENDLKVLTTSNFFNVDLRAFLKLLKNYNMNLNRVYVRKNQK